MLLGQCIYLNLVLVSHAQMSRIGYRELAHGQTNSSEDVYGERRANEQLCCEWAAWLCCSVVRNTLSALFHFFFHLFLAFYFFGGIHHTSFSTFFSFFDFLVVFPTLLFPPFFHFSIFPFVSVSILFSVSLRIFSVRRIANAASTGNAASTRDASKPRIKKTGFSAMGGRWNIKKTPSAASASEIAVTNTSRGYTSHL